MKTANFETVKNENSIKKCLEYSEYPEELKNLLGEIDVLIQFTGIKKHFPDDKEERLTGFFKITRGKREIEFNFGFSLNDTALYTEPFSKFDNVRLKAHKKTVEEQKTGRLKFKEGLLYTCLAYCSSDYYTPIDFEEFCADFGYDNDSIKAKGTWESCLKQTAKLRRIFSEKEVDYLPR